MSTIVGYTGSGQPIYADGAPPVAPQGFSIPIAPVPQPTPAQPLPTYQPGAGVVVQPYVAPPPKPPADTTPWTGSPALIPHSVLTLGDKLGSRVLSAGGWTCKLESGDLVLRDAAGTEHWRAGVHGAADLVSDKYGGVYLVDATGAHLWSTGTGSDGPYGALFPSASPWPDYCLMVSPVSRSLMLTLRSTRQYVVVTGLEGVPSQVLNGKDYEVSGAWDSTHGLMDWRDTIVDEIAQGVAIGLPIVVGTIATAGAIGVAVGATAGTAGVDAATVGITGAVGGGSGLAGAAGGIAVGAGAAAGASAAAEGGADAGAGVASAGAAATGSGAAAAGGLTVGGVVTTVGAAAGVVGTVEGVAGQLGLLGGGTHVAPPNVPTATARYETFREWMKRTLSIG